MLFNLIKKTGLKLKIFEILKSKVPDKYILENIDELLNKVDTFSSDDDLYSFMAILMSGVDNDIALKCLNKIPEKKDQNILLSEENI